VALSQGKTPKWENVFLIDVLSIHENLFIEVFDQDTAGDDLIGYCSIKVSSLIINASPKPPSGQASQEISNTFTLFLDNEPAGKLIIKTLYFEGVVEECPKEPTLERKIELSKHISVDLEKKMEDLLKPQADAEQ